MVAGVDERGERLVAVVGELLAEIEKCVMLPHAEVGTEVGKLDEEFVAVALAVAHLALHQRVGTATDGVGVGS